MILGNDKKEEKLFKRQITIQLCVCPLKCLSIYLCVCPSVCLSVYLSGMNHLIQQPSSASRLYTHRVLGLAQSEQPVLRCWYQIKIQWKNKCFIHLILSFADPSVHRRQKTMMTDMCYPTEISSLMDFGTPDCSLGKGTALLEQKGVALVTARSVHSDLSGCLEDTELSTWLGG